MIKPYYSEPGIDIYLGDCRDILPSLPKVDLVLTDPPYGVSKASWDREVPKEAIKQAWAKTSGGMLCFWSAFDLASIPSLIGESPKNTIVWWKPNLPALWMFDRSRLASQWEPLFYFAKPGYEPTERPTDVWGINYPTNGSRQKVDHPTQKPIDLLLRCLKTFPSECLIDPFMGSGTTLRAAKDLGRKAIGIEIEKKYCDIAISRLRQEVLNLT